MFLLLISTHEILNTSESTILKLYCDSFIFTTTLIYKYDYNVDIELIPFEICLIYMYVLLIQIHNFRKLLIIHINDLSDLNHSSKFIVLVVVAFTKEEKKRQRQQSIILILGFL